MLLASSKVLSSKEVEKNPVDFKMYDAILSGQKPADNSSEMDNFMPMLNDYLKSQSPFILLYNFF